MIEGMPRPRPPFLHKDTSRHGKTRWYVRPHIGEGLRGPRIRLPDAYGTPEFWDAYHEALAGKRRTVDAAKPSTGSLRWLIDLYRGSAEWQHLSLATRKQRENIFLHVCETAGGVAAGEIAKSHIAAGMDRRASTPSAANNYLKTMRSLFSWAVDSGVLTANPTLGVKRLKVRTSGFYAWTEDDVQAFERRWPIGTRERLALAILLYTGLRRGDAARLGRQHVRNGVISLRTEKTGSLVEIPILPVLQSVIDASKTGDLAFIACNDGRPMTKESFGNWFKEAAKAAGVPGNCHGLRKAGAARAAANGATEYQLNALFGWADGSREAAVYTKAANRRKLALAGVSALSGKNEE